MKPFSQLLLIGVLLACLTLEAATPADSEFRVRNWRNEDGLPHSIINSIVQTRDGYLWIGMFVGLVRFDGVRFVHFSSSNIPELESGRVSKLFEDRNGTLWIGMEDGRLLEWLGGAVRVHPMGRLNSPIVAMVQDRNDVMWLQTANGHFGYLTTNSFKLLGETGPGLARPSLGLVVDAEGQLWVGTKHGLQIWEDRRLVTPPCLSHLGERIPDSIAPARDGSIWMFCDRQLWKIKGGTIVSTNAPAQLAVDYASVLLEAADGNVWLGSSDGSLYCLAPDGTVRSMIESDLRGPNRELYADREGNLWRGSFGGGLTQIRPKLFTVHNIPTRSLDRYVYGVCSDPLGNAWALQDSSSRAIVRIEAGTLKVSVYSGQSITRNFRTLFVDSANHMWGGTEGGALCRFDGGVFKSKLEVSDKAEYISALYEDRHTNLWVGFSQGAGAAFAPHGDLTKWQTLEGMPFPDVRCIAEAADGAMWFGTHYGGVSRWQAGKWTQFTVRDGLPSDYIRCLYPDADGTLWLGTMHGLARWRDGKFSSIYATNGLWSESLSHIAEDARGNFWMSSFGGVFRVSRKSLNEFADGRSAAIQCVGYDRNDGLPSLECPGGFQPAGAKTLDGRLWFPTVDGLVSVDPSRITQNDLPPPVLVEEVTVDNARQVIRPATREVSIGPGKRRFDFRFTALSLSAPEKVRFRHKLDSLDRDWSVPDPARTVTYSYIPPGRYTFRVQACNNDGVWNEAGAALALVVTPYLWETWWFKGALGLVAAALIALAVRRVERWNARLRLERIEHEHAVERERSRIAKDIHDDLGANLTQIVFLSQRAEGASHDASEVERWIRMIPATARRTIQSLDEIVWAINPKHDSLESLANYISQFAAQYLALANVRSVLDIPTVLPAMALTAELRHNLVLATREAIQNVVTHARASEVRVALRLDDQGLNIEIADNGCGFELQPQRGDGNGLQNMRRRLQDVGGEADITSRPNHGTTVRLSVPLARLHGRVIGANGF